MRNILFGTLFIAIVCLFGGVSYAGINDGLVAYYPFDGNADDESGNGVDGTVNGATLATDRYGNPGSTYSFDGDWDYIETGTYSDFNLIHNGSDFTISLWVKHSTLNDENDGLLGNTIGGDRKGFFLGVRGRDVYFAVGRTSPYPVVGKFWENVLPEGHSWNHISITYSSVSNQYNLFINGSNTDDPVSPTNPHLEGSAYYTLKIGTFKTSYSYGWATAYIDEVRIYNRTISSAEIQQLSSNINGSGNPKYYGNFAITGATYSENDNLYLAVIAELGSQYRVADWNDIVNFYNSGGSSSAFESALSQTGMLTRDDDEWYSSSRHYYYHISQRPGQTPYDSFLSHANVGNHAFDLGSWYGLDMPVLAVKRQPQGDTDDTAKLTGNVRYNGSPVCAMILANGQYMFTCSGDGSFDLDVPLDSNGQITVYSFCSGLAPFKETISPNQSQGYQVDLSSFEDSEDMDADFSATSSSSGWVQLDGTISYNGSPVCALLLANGQHAFTCSGNGSFRLNVPLDSNDQITVYGFCSGLPPYKYIYTHDTTDGNDTFSMDTLAGNWRIFIDSSAYDNLTENYYIDVTLNNNGSLSYTEYYYGNVYDSATGQWSYNSSNRYFSAEGDGDLCSGILPSSASINSFSVPGSFYGDSGTYNWTKR